MNSFTKLLAALLVIHTCSCKPKGAYAYWNMKEKPSEKQLKKDNEYNKKMKIAYDKYEAKSKEEFYKNNSDFFKMKKHYSTTTKRKRIQSR
jgi:hypothetical protein